MNPGRLSFPTQERKQRFCWVKFSAAGGVIVVQGHKGIRLVERTAVGFYRVHWAIAFPNGHYLAEGNMKNTGVSGNLSISGSDPGRNDYKEFRCADHANGDVDPSEVFIWALG